MHVHLFHASQSRQDDDFDDGDDERGKQNTELVQAQGGVHTLASMISFFSQHSHTHHDTPESNEKLDHVRLLICILIQSRLSLLLKLKAENAN